MATIPDVKTKLVKVVKQTAAATVNKGQKANK